MGEIKSHPPVKIFAAITFNSKINLNQIFEDLESYFSKIDKKSHIFDFSDFTDYYKEEMGENLQKVLVVFAKLQSPENLPEYKIKTNELELKYSEAKKRNVNIDVGYVSEAKVVLATTKNYTHRIYLQKGIYGDVHLYFQNRSFQMQSWTYPDYQQNDIIEFFNMVRSRYFHQMGELYTKNI